MSPVFYQRRSIAKRVTDRLLLALDRVSRLHRLYPDHGAFYYAANYDIYTSVAH